MKPSNNQRLKQCFQTPCFECEERYLGCHGKCEKYQAFTKERNSKKQKRYEKFASQMFYSDETTKKIDKNWVRRIAVGHKMGGKY